MNIESASHFKNASNKLINGNLNPLVIPRKRLISLMLTKTRTFQLACPVTSDRFDSLAKTIFSLARRRPLLLTDKLSRPWFSQNYIKTSEVAPPKKNFTILANKILCSTYLSSIHLYIANIGIDHCFKLYRRRSTTKIKVFAYRP